MRGTIGVFFAFVGGETWPAGLTSAICMPAVSYPKSWGIFCWTSDKLIGLSLGNVAPIFFGNGPELKGGGPREPQPRLVPRPIFSCDGFTHTSPRASFIHEGTRLVIMAVLFCLAVSKSDFNDGKDSQSSISFQEGLADSFVRLYMYTFILFRLLKGVYLKGCLCFLSSVWSTFQ